MVELTPFQRDLLYTLSGLVEPDAETLRAELEFYTQEAVYPGQLYPNLDRLARLGLLQKGAKNDHANCFTLTRQGRHALHLPPSPDSRPPSAPDE